jgi:16S rRNA (guanine966-N2)-methyltransferase
VRIIAGRWRGRPLLAPQGEATRPTSDRAREGLFSMLQSRLGSFDGLEVADLFAGTGALGLEALSRGAARCTFVETDRTALATLKRNLATFEAADCADVRAQDAASFAGGRFDLVFLDPPYGSGMGEKALARLVENAALAPGALVSVETAVGAQVAMPGLATETQRRYGKALITLLRAE